MNSQLLKRLFRALASDNPNGLRHVAGAIVDDERRVGHEKLAAELERILASERQTQASEPPPVHRLHPLGAPSKTPFFTRVPPEQLPHHMVLAPEVESHFEQIEKEFAARTRLLKHGLRPRQRILLHGPPGCGKTLGASRLAWSTGLPLLKVRFDALLSSLFGESASNLREVFETSMAAPCLLLLDECDFIARSRVQAQDVGEASRIVNTLLQLLDEYEPPGLMVATTNVQKSLDAAIFRRFDDVIEIPKPGPAEIAQLLELSLSGVRTDRGIGWAELANSLQGLAAADIVRLATDAAKSAIIADRQTVSESDLRAQIARAKRRGP